MLHSLPGTQSPNYPTLISHFCPAQHTCYSMQPPAVHLLLIDSLHVCSTSRNEMAAQAQRHSFPTPPTNLPCYLTGTCYLQRACLFGSFVFSQFEKCNMEPRQQLTAGCAARAPSVRVLALQCWFGTGQPTCSSNSSRAPKGTVATKGCCFQRLALQQEHSCAAVPLQGRREAEQGGRLRGRRQGPPAERPPLKKPSEPVL